MRRTPANLLVHTGHGPTHLDLVLGCGGCCPTLHLQPVKSAWRAHWGAPHRRRYLAYDGPVGQGRGRVRSVWRGAVRWWRLSGGWCFRLGSMATITMRGTHMQIIAGELPRSVFRG